MRAILAISAAVMLLLFAAERSEHSAQALSCALMNPEQYVERAYIVLVGTIRSVRIDRGVHAEVDVDRYLKGSGPGTLEFRADHQAPTGGLMEREVGDSWLLLLRDNGHRYEDTLCGASRPLDADWSWSPLPSLEEIEAVTGPGTAPPDEAPPESAARISSDMRLFWAAGVAGVVAAGSLIAVGAVHIRRRQT